tara:strand:- start:1534 stop:2703 length:1170 start_codon:yes stop_codon:yes gene_type:complete
MTKKQQDFLSAVKTHFGDITTINRAQLLELSQVNASISKYPPKWLKANLVARGEYALDVSSVTVVQEERPEISQEAVKGVVSTDVDTDISFIPSIDRDYVAWGNHKTVEKVIQSKLFYPIFITGLSGNGKTFMTEQVCAKLKREMIRVNITIETDEDDLLGGFRLVDGETVFHKGPVVDAMERGAVLLLDEVDLASNKILCLQPVLEGKGVYLKKINQWVTPAEGFTIIATANTKGKGSESGAFIGTNILNEAFLERFAVTIEQEYPTVGTEKKILGRVFNTLGIEDSEFAAKLVDWADIIRRTYYDGGIDEVVSTRRLVHISKAFSIFEDRMQAIDLCINRFDDETKESFKDLYTKIDAEVEEVPEDPNFSTEIQSDNLEQTSGDMPF